VTASGRRRRWPFVIAGIVALLAVLAAAFWFLFVPNWRPPLRDGERYGIDVSAHQDEVDWQRVADDDIEFAYIKATEGGDFVDRQFERNWKGADAAGLDRGAYHFFTLCRDGAVQARHFLAVAPPDSESMAPAVDLELVGNCSRRPPTTTVHRELDEFVRLVEEAWQKRLVLYVGGEFENRYPVHKRYGRPLWLRRFLLRPNVDGWLVWQVSGFAHVDGIEGDVDLDVMRTSSSP
jgi:lysozyme